MHEDCNGPQLVALQVELEHLQLRMLPREVMALHRCLSLALNATACKGWACTPRLAHLILLADRVGADKPAHSAGISKDRRDGSSLVFKAVCQAPIRHTRLYRSAVGCSLMPDSCFCCFRRANQGAFRGLS